MFFSLYIGNEVHCSLKKTLQIYKTIMYP